MAKVRKEREISNDGTTAVFELEVNQPEGAPADAPTTTQYSVPANPEKFREFIFGLSDTAERPGDESPLARAYRQYRTQVANMARQSVYEQAASESTIIVVGGKKLDLMTFPLKNLVKAINGNRATASLLADEGDIKGLAKWQNAAARLVREGKAKENESSGMLEMVGA